MPLSSLLKLLVIDDNSDSRMLLTKTLMRKYPECAVIECQNGDTAVRLAEKEPLAAVVVHRTFEYDAETLVALLRRVNATVPIVAVSGFDRSAQVRAAGADMFLNFDAWLQIGNVVAEAITHAAGRVAAVGNASKVRLEPATEADSGTPA